MRPIAPALSDTDLRQLQIFVVIADAGGLAPAEQVLGLGVSTISSHLKALEGRLGLRLCRRGRGGFKLTPEGEAVYHGARKLLNAVDGFVTRVGRLRRGFSGPISIGLVDNTITDPKARIDRMIAEIVKAAPLAPLTVLAKPPNELLRDVLGGQLDVAIGSFPKLSLGLDYVDLYQEEQLFYCGLGHPLFSRPDAGIELAEIRTHRLVSRAYWGMRDLYDFAVSTPTATVHDMESEARLILSGAFLGFLPVHYAAQFEVAGRMRRLRPDLLNYRAPFQIAVHPSNRQKPSVAFIVDSLRRAVEIAA